MNNKKTPSKGAIICTLGPASDKPETFQGLLDAGLDVVRLNMSHGNFEDHKKRFEMVRSINDEIPILMDLSGPKIRIGNLENSIELKKGDHYTLIRENIVGNNERASLLYPNLIDEATVGNTLFLNDGLLEFNIIDKNENELICEVISGGILSSRKGVNVPDISINLYAPTEKDLKDIDETIDLEPDFYSVSFVRRTDDLEQVTKRIASHTENKIPLISKIEHADALNKIDDIIMHSDGIMVARGDLGVELPLEDIPVIQRELVNKCNKYSRPCIVATQMLESMVSSPRPTRAEVSDVASAIAQGSDAVMLSAETATGQYPVETVRVMERIIYKAQQEVKHKSRITFTEVPSVSESIGRAAVSVASGMEADYILAFTRSGITSGIISRFKPQQEIIALTPRMKTLRQTRIQWGVSPLLLDKEYTGTDEMIRRGVNIAFEKGAVERNSKLVVVAGSSLSNSSATNLVQYLTADEIINAE